MKNFVILAAGKSSRFGENKLLAEFNHKGERVTLPQMAARYALSQGAENIYLTLSRDGIETDGKRIYHPVLDSVNKEGEANVMLMFQDPSMPGPGGALLSWANIITEPFIVLFGDNLYLPLSGGLNYARRNLDSWRGFYTFRQFKEPDHRCLELAYRAEGDILVEKPHSRVSGDFFCGLAGFPANFLSSPELYRKSPRGEIEITHMLNMCESRAVPEEEVLESWCDLTYPEDYATVEGILA